MTIDDIKNTINSVLVENGEMTASDFVFGNFEDLPNKRGVFQNKSAWFIYENDERNVKSISGPFSDSDIIFACAKILHQSKYFEKYRFSSEAKHIYIHSHYRSIKEIERNVGIEKMK